MINVGRWVMVAVIIKTYILSFSFWGGSGVGWGVGRGRGGMVWIDR